MIEAAKAAGVRLRRLHEHHCAPTRSDLVLAAEHRATEELLAASGLPARPAAQLVVPRELHGPGRVPRSSTAPCSAPPARAGSAPPPAPTTPTRRRRAAGEGHEGAVYELGGDDAFTLAEYAAALSSRRPVARSAYRDLSGEDYTAALVAAGLPEGYAAVLADSDRGLSQGALFTDSGDLSRLTGRPTTDVETALRAALANTVA